LTEQRTFSARLDCRYLLRVPIDVTPESALIVTLHGFGQTPEAMLEITSKVVDSRHIIAALEGPNQFFLDPAARQVGCGWITHRHPASSIRLHHEMVRHVLDDGGRHFGIPAERRILMGFSQPVSLNYRFAANCPDAVRGVLAICGAVPSDWETGTCGAVPASILHIATREDEFYPPAVTEQYAARLRMRAGEVEFHLLDGGHRVPSNAAGIISDWLGRSLR